MFKCARKHGKGLLDDARQESVRKWYPHSIQPPHGGLLDDARQESVRKWYPHSIQAQANGGFTLF